MTKIVNEDSFTIGRSMDCTIPLQEDSISRVHLVVHRRQEHIWIEDKGSSNGTFVNNVRIAQNSLVNVVANDRIRVGKSDYVLSISLEIEERDEVAAASSNADETEVLKAPAVPQQKQQQSSAFNPSPFQPIIPKQKNSASAASGQTQDQNQASVPKPEVRRENRSSPVREENNANNYSSSPAQFEGEKILHEAHKKAAQIIYDGEIQAEKRAQAIYMEARERQSQADVYYQKKVSEAHKHADEIIINFQKQGEELLVQARQFGQEIRDEVDVLSRKLREEAQGNADLIVDEARKEAALIKNDAYEKALTKAEIEAEDLVVSAKAESQDILTSAQQQADEMLAKARNEMENELKDLKEAIDDKQKQVHHFKKEMEDLQIKAQGDQEEAELKLSEIKDEYQKVRDELETTQRQLGEARSEDAALREKIQDQKKAAADLEQQIGVLYGDSKTLERKNKELQEQLGHFSLDIRAAEDQKRIMENDLAMHKSQIKERLDRDKSQLIKESEERLHDAQLEMSKRLQKLEQEMLEEIMGRKESLVKDIIVIIETRIAKVLDPAKWDQVSSEIFDGISETLEGKAVSFTESTKQPKQSASLARKKKKENIRWMSVGITAGVIVSILGLQTYNRITSDKNPMRTLAAEESRRRQEDLERRKFNPAQVRDVKDTYTDAVIYTAGYVAAYQDPNYQQKLYKAASTYLLKTWRVDEDKSIQVLSMSSALIKELNDKKQNIHPDYVKDGVQKMRNLEKESMERMKVVLGSEVRLESYRRFEKRFFETEILKK
jgi:pSer/pThr/pTyr-binding forkhead associated (FHA) protein